MPVNIDASAASRQAIEMYDKDGDGTIAGTELNAVPESKRILATTIATATGASVEMRLPLASTIGPSSNWRLWDARTSLRSTDNLSTKPRSRLCRSHISARM